MKNKLEQILSGVRLPVRSPNETLKQYKATLSKLEKEKIEMSRSGLIDIKDDLVAAFNIGMALNGDEHSAPNESVSEVESYLRENNSSWPMLLDRLLSKAGSRDINGELLLKDSMVMEVYETLSKIKSDYLESAFQLISFNSDDISDEAEEKVWQGLRVLGENIDKYENEAIIRLWYTNESVLWDLLEKPSISGHPYLFQIRHKLLSLRGRQNQDLSVHDSRFKGIQGFGLNFLNEKCDVDIRALEDNWLSHFETCIQEMIAEVGNEKYKNQYDSLTPYLKFIHSEEKALFGTYNLHIAGSEALFKVWSLTKKTGEDDEPMQCTEIFDVLVESATAYSGFESRYYPDNDYSCHPGNEERILTFMGVVAKTSHQLTPEQKPGWMLCQESSDQMLTLLSNYFPSKIPQEISLNPETCALVRLLAQKYIAEGQEYINEDQLDQVSNEIYEALMKFYDPISSNWRFDFIFGYQGRSAKDVIVEAIRDYVEYTDVSASLEQSQQQEERAQASVKSIQDSFMSVFKKFWILGETIVMPQFSLVYVVKNKELQNLANGNGQTMKDLLKNIISNFSFLPEETHQDMQSVLEAYLLSISNAEFISFLEKRKNDVRDNETRDVLLHYLIRYQPKTVNMLLDIIDKDRYRELVVLKSKEGLSPLATAIQANQTEIVSAILKDDACYEGVFGIGEEGHSALLTAAVTGDVGFINSILSHKKCPKNILLQRNRKKESALAIACKHRNTAAALAILNPSYCTVDVLKQEGEFGEHPLMIASRKGLVDVVDKILHHTSFDKQLLRKESKYHYNVLNLACRYGHTQIVKTLLEPNNCSRGELMLQDDSGRNPLTVSIIRGNDDIARAILKTTECGREVLMQSDDDHYNALMHACMMDKKSIVKEILTRKCCDSALLRQQSDGMSALDLAIEKHPNIVEQILEHKMCDETVLALQNNEGNNILMSTFIYDKRNLSKKILSSKFLTTDMLMQQNEEGCDALLCAIGYYTWDGPLGEVKQIIKHDNFSPKGLRNQDVLGHNALMLAIQNNYMDVVDAILEHDYCDLFVLQQKNNNGEDALEIARKSYDSHLWVSKIQGAIDNANEISQRASEQLSSDRLKQGEPARPISRVFGNLENIERSNSHGKSSSK